MSANKTLIIGLTGGMGSGKSEAARHLKTLGAVHVDADAVSRSLTAPGGEALPAIREVFGDEVFYADGTLDRRALGAVVFSSVAARHALEGIIHPRVQRIALEMADAAREADEDAVLMDVPLLFETGMDALCDVTIVISADIEERIRRVMSRDGLTREDAEARFASQMTDEDRCERATHVICNNTSMERFKNELTNVYTQLIRAGR